jgi:hypothetical protein
LQAAGAVRRKSRRFKIQILEVSPVGDIKEHERDYYQAGNQVPVGVIPVAADAAHGLDGVRETGLSGHKP